jgi:hypothetical protein
VTFTQSQHVLIPGILIFPSTPARLFYNLDERICFGALDRSNAASASFFFCRQSSTFVDDDLPFFLPSYLKFQERLQNQKNLPVKSLSFHVEHNLPLPNECVG